jgi:asparagine synthase (glutamine-hydrolysing)
MSYHPDKGSQVEEKDSLITIILNGEIYNYQELRDELELKGYVFSSKTDTEVVLASYLEW